jgi:hypothetical protein
VAAQIDERHGLVRMLVYGLPDLGAARLGVHRQRLGAIEAHQLRGHRGGAARLELVLVVEDHAARLAAAVVRDVAGQAAHQRALARVHVTDGGDAQVDPAGRGHVGRYARCCRAHDQRVD